MLSKLHFNSFCVFIVSIGCCIGQEGKFNAGINAGGLFFNSLDVVVDYNLKDNRTITLSFGRQFNRSVPELSNSKNSTASGNFFRLGYIFTPKTEKKTTAYFKPEIVLGKIEHHAEAFFTDTYEKFTIPFDYEKTYWGLMLGAGVISRLKQFQFTGGFSIGTTKNIKYFMLDGYSIPGFGNGVALERDSKSNIFVRPEIIIKYCFRSLKIEHSN